jgi:hypothetical protein
MGGEMYFSQSVTSLGENNLGAGVISSWPTERSSEITPLSAGLFADVCGRPSWSAKSSHAVGVKYLFSGRR